MHRDGSGLDQCSLFVAQVGRQPVHNSARHRDVLRESAVTPILAGRDTQYLAIVAEVDIAARAEETLSAVDGRIKGDAIACLQVVDVGADLRDFAGGFVSHHQRRNAASGATVVSMYVAAADAAG